MLDVPWHALEGGAVANDVLETVVELNRVREVGSLGLEGRVERRGGVFEILARDARLA